MMISDTKERILTTALIMCVESKKVDIERF